MTTQQYLTWFDEVVAPTEPMFLLVPPENLDWRPVSTSFSLGQLLSHIPLSFSFMAKVINKEELPFKSMREIFVSNRRQQSSPPEEAIALLKSCTGDYRRAISELTNDQFQNDLLDTPQKGRVPYWRYAAFTLEHHIHHLMELHISLKALGVKVNTATLYVR